MYQTMPRTMRPSVVIAIADRPKPPATMKTSPPAPQIRSAQVIFRQYRKFPMPNHLFLRMTHLRANLLSLALRPGSGVEEVMRRLGGFRARSTRPCSLSALFVLPVTNRLERLAPAALEQRVVE